MAEDRLFLGYETAFWIWRKAGPSAFSALTPTRVRSLAGGMPTASKIRAFKSEHPDLALENVDCIVKYGDQRELLGAKCHIKRASLPERSFYRLDDNVYVASPELCLMQLASKLSEPQVTKLALEMCGAYALEPVVHSGLFDYLDPLDDDPGMCKRPPLTSATKLKSYAKRLFVPDSRARSAHFLRYVVDGSASPRETLLFMLLCMPPRLGGYGFALPELNRRIELTPAEQLMVGANHYDCDLYWPHPRVGVEYDSRKHHSALEKQEHDAVRRNMLQYKGVQVVVATRMQLKKDKTGEFDKLARQIARAVGKRLRIPKKEHVEERERLRDVLYDWDALPAPPASPDEYEGEGES